MTTRMSIVGVDGAGKTTFLEALGRRLSAKGLGCLTQRAPQYFVDADLPFHGLSKAMERLGKLADVHDNAAVKACALFLATSLAGEVERFILHAFRPDILLAERHCVLDSVIYSRFYLPRLPDKLDPASVQPLLAQCLDQEAEASLSRWLRELSRRAGTGLAASFWDVPTLAKDLFANSSDLPKRLLDVYQASWPDAFLMLEIDEGSLVERLAAKAVACGRNEIHETVPKLLALQAAMKRTLTEWVRLAPQMTLTVVDVSQPDALATLERAAIGVTGIGASRWSGGARDASFSR